MAETERRFYTPGEVAALFRVDPKTVSRWVIDGRFPRGSVTVTPGGHKRFDVTLVNQMIEKGTNTDDATETAVADH